MWSAVGRAIGRSRYWLGSRRPTNGRGLSLAALQQRFRLPPLSTDIENCTTHCILKTVDCVGCCLS